MKPAVEQAVDEIRRSFAGRRVDVDEDPDGGAYVKVHDLSLGDRLTPNQSFVAFHITFQYPHADVYPHFLVPGLKRADGTALEPPFHPDNQQWAPPSGAEPATMVSRRSNHSDPNVDTACGKLHKVLQWIRDQ